MTAEDLRLWSWVRYHESKRPFQVVGITNESVVIPSYDSSYLNDTYEPIPIEGSILDGNGWVFKNSVYVLKSQIRFGWKPQDGTLIVGYHEWPVKVFYVHQLQNIFHALGLPELSRTFQIL